MKNNSNFAIRISQLPDERGVALLVVLWIFIFLFVVAFDFTASVREEGNATRRYAEEGEGYYLALAGFERGLYELLGQFSQPRQGGASQSGNVFDEDCSENTLGEGSYRVCLIDEAGRINLNRADEETLRRIFSNLEIEEPRSSTLVDSILDWRDEDDLHRLNGAESDYYLSLSPSYTAKNGPFDSVEELLWVRGATPEIFYGQEKDGAQTVGLRKIFTVDSPMDRVNARTMSAEVCHALTGLPLAKCREFVMERKRLSEKTLADVLKLLGIAAGDTALRQFVFTNPSVITIEAAGQPADSVAPRRVRGVVRLGGGQRGFELIRWLDRDIIRTE